MKFPINYSHTVPNLIQKPQLHISEVQFPYAPLSHSAAHFSEVNGTMCFRTWPSLRLVTP